MTPDNWSRALAQLLYGPDFLFVEEVLRIEGSGAETAMTYSPDHPILAAHFRGGPPVVPGTILAEQVCQSALLVGLLVGAIKVPLQSRLTRLAVELRSPAVAPCRVLATVRVTPLAPGRVAIDGATWHQGRQLAHVTAEAAFPGRRGAT
ncbi:hypothetical protein [Azospirillum argentinense]